MTQGIDLHTHSNISDGALSPENLILLAKEKSIHTLALTDHDSIDGIHRAEIMANQQQIKLIHGVEISSQWNRVNTKKSYGVHIVALNMQNLEPLQELLTKQQNIRQERAKQICHKLQKVTGYNPFEDILPTVDGQAERITRSHIAQALLNKKIVSRLQTAFDAFLKQGKSAYVDFHWTDLKQVIDAIHHAQGFAILAHPCDYNLSATNLRYLIDLFKQLNGDAIELAPESKPLSTRQMLNRCIQQNQLKVSIGSDFHGEHMPWRKLGHTPSLNEQHDAIWNYFK